MRIQNSVFLSIFWLQVFVFNFATTLIISPHCFLGRVGALSRNFNVPKRHLISEIPLHNARQSPLHEILYRNRRRYKSKGIPKEGLNASASLSATTTTAADTAAADTASGQNKVQLSPIFQKRKRLLRPFLLRIFLIPVSILLAFPLRAVAFNPKSAIHNFKRGLPSARVTIRLVALSLVVSFLIQTIRVRRRQALDATSEWSRYANHPITRAKAVGSLLGLQLLPLWILTRILSSIGQKDRAERLRTLTGNSFADGLLRLG